MADAVPSVPGVQGLFQALSDMVLFLSQARTGGAGGCDFNTGIWGQLLLAEADGPVLGGGGSPGPWRV